MPTQTAEIYQIAEKFRAAIARKEGKAAVAMVREYGKVFEALQKKLALMRERILAAGDKGEEISPAWLFRQERYHTLLAEVAVEMRRFAIYASDSISDLQREAVKTALDSAEAQFEGRGMAATWSRLPAAEVEQQVGFVSAGPLKQLLDQIGPDARERVSALLVEAVSLGYNPRKTAQKIQAGLKGALAGGLTRALRIARTETMRAYREAAHHQFKANADILEGWYWVATLGLRTCPACLALHGTFHQLDERQAAHVNCRCTQIAAIEGEPSLVPERGPEWLAKQPEKFQREFFADTPGAFEAYKAGDLTLEAFCGRRENRIWGPSYQALTTGQAKAGLGQFPGDAKPPRRRRPAVPPTPSPAPAPAPGAAKPLTAAEAKKKIIDTWVSQNQEEERLRQEYEDAAKRALASYETADKALQDATSQETKDKYETYKAFKRNRLERLREILYQGAPADFETDFLVKPDDSLAAEWKRGLESFKRFIGDRWLKGKRIHVVWARNRANYSVSTVRLTQYSGAATMVHELGHWLEDMEPEVFEAVTAFLDRRTQGEAPVNLSKWDKGYKAHEKTRPDKFMAPYMGKVYEREEKVSIPLPDGRLEVQTVSRRWASEIISMGLEYFYSKPAEFATNDPDYFDFIYNLVRQR